MRTSNTGGWAALSALGVVFGDLGTSPLYTLQTVVQATGGQFTPDTALGILSLVVWTLIVTISIKYCVFVMRADNQRRGRHSGVDVAHRREVLQARIQGVDRRWVCWAPR